MMDIVERIKETFITDSGKLTRKISDSRWLEKNNFSSFIEEIENMFPPSTRDVVSIKDKVKCLVKTGSSKCPCGNSLEIPSDFHRYLCYSCRKIEKDQKRKETTFEKYGVDHISQLDSTKEKYKETCRIKHGFDHSFKNPSVQDKRKTTLFNNHGVENPFQSEKVKENIKKTHLENLGVENVSQSPFIKEKKKSSYIKKYGVSHPRKNAALVREQSEKRKQNYWDSLNENQKWFFENLEEIYEEEHIINENTISYICKKYRVPFNYTKSKLKELNLPIIRRYYVSQGEREILEFIRTFYDGEVITNDRSVLGDNYEIDIYIPEYNLGIEYHGSYWHSNTKEEKHLEKYNRAKEKGIKLLQIFDWELEEKQQLVHSIIKSNLSVFDDRIYARQCKVRTITNEDYETFCESNHIQGYHPAKIKLGLFFRDELVSIMSFSSPRFTKKYTYEMIRYATKTGTIIIGGASKLFSHMKKNCDFDSIITYSDNRLFTGDVYHNLGFTFTHETNPNYWYTTGGDYIPRYQAQKHKLKDLLGEENFNPNNTEKENMISNGYRIVYDAGNKVFVFNK